MNLLPVLLEVELEDVLLKLLTLPCRRSCGSTLDAQTVLLPRRTELPHPALGRCHRSCVSVTARSVSLTTSSVSLEWRRFNAVFHFAKSCSYKTPPLRSLRPYGLCPGLLFGAIPPLGVRAFYPFALSFKKRCEGLVLAIAPCRSHYTISSRSNRTSRNMILPWSNLVISRLPGRCNAVDACFWQP